MTSSTITCPQCGTHNSLGRLWCQHCGRPVPSGPTPPAVHQAEDAQRADLYLRLIEDIEQASQADQIDVETFHLIKAFSADQLAQIDGRTRERKRLHQLHQIVLRARAAANSDRLKEAIEILGNGLHLDRGEFHLQSMIAEVKAKIRQREELLAAKRKADGLLHEANTCIDAGQLETAQDKLKLARQCAPSDKQILAALNSAEQKISRLQTVRQLEREAAERQRAVVSQVAAKQQVVAQSQPIQLPAASQETPVAEPLEDSAAKSQRLAQARFADDDAEETPNPMRRLIDSASQWSSVIKPFLLDNFGWFVGAFLVVAGFVVLIVTFWGTIEQNRILMHSLVYLAVAAATGMFFAVAYFMRLKYPQLETSSNVLLVIVALLIPLLFMAAVLTSFIPVTPADVALLTNPG